jgi:hypothetical protein
MENSTKRTLLIAGSLLTIAGVIYFFSKRSKSQSNIFNTSNEIGSTDSTTSPLDSIDKIKAFQDWMDTIGPWVKGSDGKYKLLNKGNGYGVYGPSTKAAWNYYGKKYINSLSVI